MSKGCVKTQAAVAFGPNEPLRIVELDLELPKNEEVLVKFVAAGLCHTDYYTASGSDPEGRFPCVLGHEGVGRVEALGEGCGDEFALGDLVIPLYTSECRECQNCRATGFRRTNLCTAVRATQGQGLMPDGTSRFSYLSPDGTRQTVFHFMGVSSFSHFSVLSRFSLAKIDSDIVARMNEKGVFVPCNNEAVPFALSHLCLLGCAVPTGVGAALNALKNVDESALQGDLQCAIFGAGLIGLSVLQGLRLRGVKQVLMVDINDKKLEAAREKFGATATLNIGALLASPGADVAEQQAARASVLSALMEKTPDKMGFDFTFECVGKPELMRIALEVCRRGSGESVIIGVAAAGQEISTRPFQLVTGRRWSGSAFGGVKGKSELGDYIRYCLDGSVPLANFISEERPIEDINGAIETLKNGASYRIILSHGP